MIHDSHPFPPLSLSNRWGSSATSFVRHTLILHERVSHKIRAAPSSFAGYNGLVMAEGAGKKDDGKVELDSTGQAVAYISLD